MRIGIVKRKKTLFPNKKIRSGLFLDWVPISYTDIQIAPKDKAQERSDLPKAAYFPMDIFIFNQAAHLSVQHPIKLRCQDHMIPIVPVLGEERQPAGSADELPLP